MAADLETLIFTSSEESSTNDCNSAVNDKDKAVVETKNNIECGTSKSIDIPSTIVTTALNNNGYDLIDEEQSHLIVDTNNIQKQFIAEHSTNLCPMDYASIATFNTPNIISVDTPKCIDEIIDEKESPSIVDNNNIQKQLIPDHITIEMYSFKNYYSDQMAHHSYSYSLDQSLTNIASEEQIIIKEERQHEEYPSPNLMFGYSTETSQSLGTPSRSLGTPSQSADTSLQLVVTPSESIDIDDYKLDTCNNLETIDE